MDLMGLSATVYNKINIHIGGAYGDKQATLKRWIDNYHRLDPNTQMRLTVENDDKANMYSVKRRYMVYLNNVVYQLYLIIIIINFVQVVYLNRKH